MSRMQQAGSFVALAVVVSLFLPVAPAGAETLACGDVVVTDVVLQNDLRNCPSDGLIVGASGITIDLNGHLIDGSDPVDLRGSGVDVSRPYGDVTIENGTIREFTVGVTLGRSDDNTLRNLRLADNGKGVEVAHGQRNELRSLQLHRNGSVGARLHGADHTIVVGNRVRGGRWGFIAEADANGNRIARNRVIGDATSISRGIQVGVSSGGNVVTDNLVIGYHEYGISATEVATDTTVSRNRVVRNGIHGVFVDGTSTATVVARNQSIANTVDGIHVEAGAVGTTITANRVRANGNHGIAADAPVIDGGGNRASDNGQSTQCVGVVCR